MTGDRLPEWARGLKPWNGERSGDGFALEAEVFRYAEEAKAAREKRDLAICAMRRDGAYLCEIAGAAGMARSNVSKILHRHGLR